MSNEIEEIKGWYEKALKSYGKIKSLVQEPNAYTRIQTLLFALEKEQERMKELKHLLKITAFHQADVESRFKKLIEAVERHKSSGCHWKQDIELYKALEMKEIK